MAETTKPKSEAEIERDQAAENVDYIEYLGEAPHGVSFLTSHTIPKGDALWKRHGVEMTKDVTWERDPATAKPIGQKGTRLLVKTSDLPPDAVAVLEKTVGFKRVSE